MKNIPCDMHTHSVFSHDGGKDSGINALCMRAIELGLSDLAITDHCDVNGEAEKIYASYDSDGAWQAMCAAKEKYRGSLNLILGIELGQPEQYPEVAEAFLRRHPYEFIIGSVHNLDRVPDFCMMNFEYIPDALASQLFDRTLDEMNALIDFPITTLAHLTYQTRYMAMAGKSFDFAPHRDKTAALLKKLISRGIALEVNVSTVWRGLGFTMPQAETASTFNEVLTVTAAIQAAQDKDEKLALIESQLSDACQIICDIYSRFLFESSVFEARPQEFLDADRLCQLMLEAQKKAYGDGLDQTCLHPYMWLCKGHYYSGSLSFYNFPYAFGGLFARGLYAKYQQEGEKFVPLYKEMLHATSVNDVEDTAKIAGIDLTDKAFWRQGLQSLADEIDLFCDLVK